MKRRQTLSEATLETFPPIDGSRLRRAFCRYCQQPIRITLEFGADVLRGREDLECSDCAGGNPKSKAHVITPRQRPGLGKTGA